MVSVVGLGFLYSTLEESRMKLRVIGLMFVGSLFLGALAQAQEATPQEYREALEKAIEAVNQAKDEHERQEAEENVKELEAALKEAGRVAVPTFDVPRFVRAVSVECNGECTDNTLGQLCNLAGTGLTPIAVDCRDVDDDNPGVTCAAGVASDNRCLPRTVSSSDPLSEYCDDSSGWDAQVYCAAQ
jgi:hypothetical protein